MCMFCRSLIVLLTFFFFPSCCLFLFDLRILITPLVSPNSSYTTHSLKKNEMSWIYSITYIQKFKNSRKCLCFNASADFYSSYNFVVVLCLVNCCNAFYSWIQIFMSQLTVIYSSKLILLWFDKMFIEEYVQCAWICESKQNANLKWSRNCLPFRAPEFIPSF